MLTSQQRVQRAFNRQDHDRVPRFDTYWDDTIERWTREGLTGGRELALSLLGADLREIHHFMWPEPFPGRRDVIAETENTIAYTDAWGQSIRHFKGRSTTPEHLGWECASEEIWRKHFRDRILNNLDRINFPAAQSAAKQAREENKWTFIIGLEPFEILRKLVGDVTTLVAMIEEPEWIRDMAEVTTRNTLDNYQRLIDAGFRPDGFWVYGDMAYNHSTMCSPNHYRELIWPSHKALADWAHQHGMRFIFHTDGNVNGVLELFLEAGFDALQPLESKASMDIRQICPRYGNRLLTFGNIDVMSMIDNDLDRIEAEIESKLAAGKATKGYIYHSDHSIPPQVSWQTYQEIVKLVDKHGDY